MRGVLSFYRHGLCLSTGISIHKLGKVSNRNYKFLYTSQSQLSFTGFETPFYNGLDPSNRWVVLSSQIPWDMLVNLFNNRNPPKSTGLPALNPRVLIGAVIIKQMLNLDDRETVAQITENMYQQYFLGYSSYIKRPPFDASLFVDIRKRPSIEHDQYFKV